MQHPVVKSRKEKELEQEPFKVTGIDNCPDFSDDGRKSAEEMYREDEESRKAQEEASEDEGKGLCRRQFHQQEWGKCCRTRGAKEAVSSIARDPHSPNPEAQPSFPRVQRPLQEAAGSGNPGIWPGASEGVGRRVTARRLPDIAPAAAAVQTRKRSAGFAVQHATTERHGQTFKGLYPKNCSNVSFGSKF